MSSTVPFPLFANLIPFSQLSNEQRTQLAAQSKIFPFVSGYKLTATREYPWLTFLITGRLNFTHGTRQEIIEAKTLRTSSPLFTQTQLRDSALAIDSGQILRVDRQLYEYLTNNLTIRYPPVSELRLNDFESRLLSHFYTACQRGWLALPSLPKIAHAIQDAMNNPDISTIQLARIIQMDPAVTGSLVQLANSAAYRGVRPVSDVRSAILRIGLTVTRSVVISLALKQIFQVGSPLVKHFMKSTWNRSVHVSALSFVIARHCPGFSPEQALLAGLLHDIGVIPILDYISRGAHNLHSEELQAAILKLSRLLGEIVIEHWGLGTEMIAVVRESGFWYHDPQLHPGYCDIVRLALLYRLNQADTYLPIPRYDAVPTYFRLGLGEQATQPSIDIIAEASEELAALIAILKRE